MDYKKAQMTPAAKQSWTKLDDTTLFNQETGETKKVSTSVANSYSPTVQPTGNLTQVTLGNKTVTLDNVASSSMSKAFDEIKALGQNLIV